MTAAASDSTDVYAVLRRHLREPGASSRSFVLTDEDAATFNALVEVRSASMLAIDWESSIDDTF
jgi:hypothetical protein